MAESATDEASEPAAKETSPPESELIDLPSGGELSEQDAVAIERAVPTRLVVVAGPAGCGKTTLIISLYELFQWQHVSGYLFAGSRTLPGFERRCFDSRIASERDRAETRRTRYADDEAHYLHLAVARIADVRLRIDFLFTDLSGESFERARDSTTECQQLSFLRRTEHFIVLLDGEKFTEPAKRWAIIQEAQLLLRSCLDSGMLGKNTFIEVMMAKFDYFEVASDRSECDAAYTAMQNDFRARFENRLGRLIFSETAARPLPNRNLDFGHGLSGLLERLVGSTPRNRAMQLTPISVTGAREADAFLTRHLGTTQ
jgi:hypothetical protein